MRETTWIGALLLAAAVLLAGCATVNRSEAQSTEQLLAAAGFRAEPADTPAKLENLKAMPPRKLVSHAQDDHFVYSYADPDNCKCLYVGGPEEYSAYERLSLEKQNETAMDWNLRAPEWW